MRRWWQKNNLESNAVLVEKRRTMEFIKPESKVPAPGKEVDAYCGKCKLELAHVIIAMKGSKIARVECKTCHAVHAYRGSAPAPRKPRAGGKKTKAALTVTEYDRLIEGRDLSGAKPYRPATTFAADDIINHATFGLGVVIKVLSDQKIEVGFPVGIKVLVHDRG
jgi:hypothetical protein